MRYLITGGSGMVGSKLIPELLQSGHEVVNLSRSNRPSTKQGLTQVQWDGKSIPDVVGKIDIVVNLAGANVGKRWTDSHKKLIMDSRINVTRACAEFINRQAEKPVLISASGTNYYGENETEAKVETDPAGPGFLAEVCKVWEHEAQQAQSRTVIMRIPPVLSTEGGPLEKLLTPYKMFVGGPTGTGDQGFAWVHVTDMVRAIRFFADTPDTQGPYNISAPELVTNKQFSTLLGKALNRPSFFRLPKFALNAIFGEMSVVLWGGILTRSDKLRAAGFEYQFPTLKEAFADLLD